MGTDTAACGDKINDTFPLCINSPPFGITLSPKGTQSYVKRSRGNLYNTRCFYYTQPGGCTKPNCRFLHDEEPTATVFCGLVEEDYTAYGYFVSIYTHPHIKVEDARIFFGNLPPAYGEAFIRSIVEPHGEIRHIDIWGTNLKNRHQSGFVHMKSTKAANSAIFDINHTLIDGAQLYANLKSSDVYWRPLPGWDPSLLYNEPDMQPVHS